MANELITVDNYCVVDKTSLKFKKDVTKNEWQKVFDACRHIEGCVQFWIGDLLKYREQEWGMYKDAVEETGMAKKTLWEYKNVSEKVESSARAEDLTYAHHREIAPLEPEKQKEWLGKASNNKWSVRELKDAIRKEKLEADKGEPITDLNIRNGDFKKVLSDIHDIDAIITDPPYPKEYIECFTELGLFAKYHLKKDGFMAAYSGQYNLPEVIERLSEHLTYVWTFCLYHVGKNQLVNGVNIMCGWKPVLIFSNGKKKMRFSAYDVLVSEQREKDKHEWQQSESGVQKLIEIFSKPRELVVDPFAGSGTFGIISNRMGRRFIGAEIK